MIQITINPTKGIVEEVDEEEDLVESKFEKMDEQDDIHTTYAKLSDVKLDREELFTKVDKVNQTIGAQQLKNNFLAERTK